MKQISQSSKKSLLLLLLLAFTSVGYACTIAITANPGTNICPGTSVTFTATESSGTAPYTYVWKVNGITVSTTTGTSSTTTTYSNSGLSSGDIVRCELTAQNGTASDQKTISYSSQSSISANFNSTSIPSGRYIWFSAVVSVSGITTYPTTLYFKNQVIAGPGGSLSVGNSKLIIDNTVSTASTTYTGGEWVTTAPPGNNNYFISGYSYPVTTSIPGSLTGLSWSGTFYKSAAVTVSWKWSAAVYTSFSTTLTSLGVKPSDCSGCSSYSNSDKAGSPESFKASVTSGALGTGGSNYTGTLTSASAVTPCSVSLAVATHPSSSSVCAGSTASFTATATGTPAPTVQWQLSTNSGSSWSDISGATATTYSFTSASGDNGKQYRAVFTNLSGSVTTNAATLTINTTPTVTTNPSSSTVCSGSAASFTAAATGSTSVQWQLSTNSGSSWSNISGATNTSYSFTSALADNGKQYRAVFTNSCGSSNSNGVTLTVSNAPAVSSQPSATTVCAGTSASFTVAGTGNVSWQSSPDGTNWTNTGNTSTTYSFTTATGDNGKQYRAVLTTSCGSATSNAALLTVQSALSVSTQPGSLTKCAGETASFTSATSASSTIQWQLSTNSGGSWANISGATSGTYAITTAAADNGKQFRAVFTNTCGSVNSNAATLTVNTPPSVTTNPSNVSLCSGTTASFTAAASSTLTATTQWQLSTNSGGSWTNISGATNNTYSFTAVTADNGKQYRAVYTNSCGSVNTTAATLTITTSITPSVSISSNPGTTVCSGTSVTFTANPVNGGTAPTYEWKKNNILMGTGSTYTTSALSGGDIVKVLMTSNAPCASPATVDNSVTISISSTVTPSVTVNASPSTTICAGTSVTFTATPVNGGVTPGYQWKKNGNIISGATLSTYTSNSLSNNDVISVVMTSSATCASPSTGTGSVTMTVNPLVTPSVSLTGTPPGAICAGTPVTFTASPVNGGTTPVYHWKKNNVVVGTNSNSYSDNALNNNDVIAIEITSNATCATPSSASNSLTMSVNPVVVPSVGISASPSGSICSGTPVTFTATPTNGGTTPSYQWKKNGTNVGTNSTSYTNSALNDDDIISVTMTSNATCAAPATATNSIQMDVAPSVTPMVSITAAPGTSVCDGSPVTFTAIASNAGATPAYQWKKNGNNVGTNNVTYTPGSLNTGDQISVVMTSSASCVTSATATSNTLTMTINPLPSQPAAFTASASTVYQGQVNVTYTVPNTAGVTYNWSYSGTGATIISTGNSATVNYNTMATGGVLSVTASSNSGCGTSAPRTINVTVLPYMTWECNSNSNWNNASNWDGGFVPYGTISVHIPASATCQPNIPADTFSVRDFVIEEGAGLTIDSSSVLNVNGTTEINGSVCGGYMVLNGTSVQSVSGNGTVCNLELNNPDGATITNGDTIHISQHYLPTDGVLTTNGGLELLSDSTGTATIGEHPGVCSTYIVGNVIVNKWIHGGRRAFRFLAHPFSTSIGLDQLTDDIDITGQDGSANGFTSTGTNNPSAFWYNTLTGNGSSTDDNTGWIPFTNTNGAGVNAWNPMQGARILIRGEKGEGFGCCVYTPAPVTLDMTGPVNQCDITVTTQTNANAGYNFIGNPYASNIDLSLSTRGSAIGANFAVWDPNQGVFGAYVCQPFEFSYILPAYSSFIVTSSSNSNNAITFHESDKTNSAATHNLFKTTGSFGNNAVQLKIMSNNDSLTWDRLLVFFDNQSNTAKDAKDARKLNNPSLDFYTISSDNQKLAVDFRPLTNNSTVQLGLRADSQRTYKIRVADYDVAPGTTLYLKDKFLNQATAMTQGMDYSFNVTSNPLSQGDNRFEITVNSTTGIAHVAGNDIRMKLSPNPATDAVRISFEAAKRGNTQISITNMLGQQVYSYSAGEQQSGEITVPLNDYAQGVYIITLNCGDQVMTERLIKK